MNVCKTNRYNKTILYSSPDYYKVVSLKRHAYPYKYFFKTEH